MVQFPEREGLVLFSAPYSVDTRDFSPGLNRPESDPNHLLQEVPLMLHIYSLCDVTRLLLIDITCGSASCKVKLEE